ncbi:MAG: nuclear transport factor 2 family protein [Chthoniobacterales bacterium]
MGAALDIVQQAYAAFGRHDITALMKLIADEVDWECVAPATLPYAGRRRTPKEVANFFEDLPKADDIHAFEPREFIEAGEHVTVLGWEKTTAMETKKLFETEWVHVFTVKSGKITRWRGLFNTAARYDS